jgi:hypothetical protein
VQTGLSERKIRAARSTRYRLPNGVSLPSAPDYLLTTEHEVFDVTAIAG